MLNVQKGVLSIPLIVPGEYTKAELQRILGASSKTIDRYRKRFDLKDKEGPNQAIRILVDEDASKKIHEFLIDRVGHSIVDREYESDVCPDLVLDVSRAADVQTRLHELEKEKIRLEGDLKERNALLSSKDELILSRQNEIETLKTSLDTMKSSFNGLQASLMLLERENKRLIDKDNPPIPMIAMSKQPQGFWARLKSVFS